MKPRIETASWITFAAIFLIATSLLDQSLATKNFRQRLQDESRILHRPFNETSMGNTWDLPAVSESEDRSRMRTCHTFR